MKSILAVVLFGSCVLFSACGDNGDARDAQHAAQLGVTVKDWLDIKRLTSEEKGFVISTVKKVDNGTAIEVLVREPGDLALEHGGPIFQYEKGIWGWKQLRGFSGSWKSNSPPEPPR
jgi:hypothetical protein